MKTFFLLMAVQIAFLQLNDIDENHQICKSMWCVNEARWFLDMEELDNGVLIDNYIVAQNISTGVIFYDEEGDFLVAFTRDGKFYTSPEFDRAEEEFKMVEAEEAESATKSPIVTGSRSDNVGYKQQLVK